MSPALPPPPAASRGNLHATHSLVAAQRRACQWGCHPFTLWLTGLSGAGKSTLAHALEQALFERGVPSLVLDGDNLRLGLNQDLGFDGAARQENIRRTAEVARLANQAGLPAIVALISPRQADRAAAQRIIGAERFVEVHVATPLAVCEQRDPKALYRKARSRQLADFTGISAPYEPPSAPALRLDASQASVAASLQQLMGLLEAFVLWPSARADQLVAA